MKQLSDFVQGELDGFNSRPAQKWTEEYQEGYMVGLRALHQDESGEEDER